MKPICVLLAIALVSSGCAYRQQETPVIPGPYGEAAKHLDFVARSVEEFGTISVSAPYIIKPSDSFKFGLERTAQDYYNEIGVQGASQNRQFRVIDAQSALSVNLEEVAKALASFAGVPTPSGLDRLKNAVFSFETAQTALSADTGLVPEAGLTPQQLSVLTIARDVLGRAAVAPEPATPLTFTSPEMPELLTPEERQALSALPDFTAALPTFDGDLSITNTEKIMLSNHAKTTQDLLNWLAYPNELELGPGKAAYLCLLTVSCSPGFVTREGYAAEVTVSARYAGPRGESDDIYPSVVAAYPMIDGQVLDLRSSIRERYTFAMQLMASGFGIAGQQMLDYARQLEQDAQSMSVITTGNAVSYGGYSFGYRIEPRFAALGDPSNKKSTAAMRLESRTFPALVLLVADTQELDPKVGGNKAEGADTIHFHIDPRWVPINQKSVQRARLSEQVMLARANALDNAYTLLTNQVAKTSKEPPFEEYSQFHTLERRYKTMEAAGMGTRAKIKLPLQQPEPSLLETATFDGWVNGPTLLLLRGSNLSDAVKHVSIGGLEAKVLDVQSSSIAVLFPGWPATVNVPNAAKIEVATNTGVQGAGTVTFNKTRTPVPSTPTPPTLAVERDTKGNITKLELKGDEGKLVKLEQLEGILKQGGSGSFSIDVSGEASAEVSSN